MAPQFPVMGALLGPTHFVARLLDNLAIAGLVLPLMYVFLLVLLRVLLRYEVAALAAWCLRGFRQDIIDERMGIVLLRMAWGVRERGGDQLTVWEAFKVYDRQIHAVEAFMRSLPIDKRNGGWE